MTLPTELAYLDPLLDVLVDELIARGLAAAETTTPIGNQPIGVEINNMRNDSNGTAHQSRAASA